MHSVVSSLATAVIFLLIGSVALAPACVPVSKNQFFFRLNSSATNEIIGEIEKIDAEFVVFAQSKDRIPTASMVSLRRVGKPRPPWPSGPLIVLANGDRMIGQIVENDGLGVKIRAQIGLNSENQLKSDAVVLGLPLTALAVVWFTPPVGDVASPVWLERDKKRDLICLRNGDVVSGTVEHMDADGVRFRPHAEKAAKLFARADLAAVAFDPSLVRLRVPKSPYARIVLANGTRLSIKSWTADSTHLFSSTLSGSALRVPLAELIALDVFQAQAAYLSDLKPTHEKVEAFGDTIWHWRADRSVKGGPLRLLTADGVSTFDKGLGVHSRTTLSYDLAGRYRRFEATVGLDATTGKSGSADVRLLIDGKNVGPDGLTGLNGSVEARQIRIDVTKAKSMTIMVDYGQGGDIQDDVNIVDARFVE